MTVYIMQMVRRVLFRFMLQHCTAIPYRTTIPYRTVQLHAYNVITLDKDLKSEMK